eukprot:scaffold179802_cov35-Tisochrysis_lutea.AAC.3
MGSEGCVDYGAAVAKRIDTTVATVALLLTSPVIPAAGSVCPQFALMLPKTRASLGFRCVCSEAMDLVSIGSPNAVPVPCASMNVSWCGLIDASSSAASIKLCCDWPFGAVKLALLPSWRTQLPSKLTRLRWELSNIEVYSATAQHASPRA